MKILYQGKYIIKGIERFGGISKDPLRNREPVGLLIEPVALEKYLIDPQYMIAVVRNNDLSFCMCVDGVYEIANRGAVVTGLVKYGQVKCGDEIDIQVKEDQHASQET